MLHRPDHIVTLSLLLAAFLLFTSPDHPKHDVFYRATKAISLKKFTMLQRSPASDRDHHEAKSGMNVVIAEGEVAYLDGDIDIDILTINGELHCDSSLAPETMELKAKTIHVNGTFQCGTTQQPYTKKFIISLKDSDMDPKANHGYRGIIVGSGGKLNLNGDRKQSGWYKLDKTVHVGDQSIFIDLGIDRIIDEAPTGLKALRPYQPTLHWKVGDEIVIGPTGYNYEEAEKFFITSIGKKYPYEIQLDHPVQFSHWGEKQLINTNVMGSFKLDERAEVANLTRSILIRADESMAQIDEGIGELAQRGGHMMVHHGGEAYLDSIELYKMGQAGVMARYPFHWHWVGTATGQYVKNSSIHHSYQRCITVHRTHNTLLENNVCYDFKGHGYFLEDGNEVNNKLINNLAIMARAPSSTKVLLASDNVATSEGQGRFPSVSGFWISNPKNIIHNNVVSGSVGSGFWMAFENEVKDLNGNIIATPIKEVTSEFSYNTAHATRVGITWDGAPTGPLTNNPNNPNDRKLQGAHYRPPVIPTFSGLKAYKNLLTGIYFRGQTVIYKNNIVADNGWSFWLAYNQIIKDSVFIGKTQNISQKMDSFFYEKNLSTGRRRKTGIVLYDGPFEIHNSDFIDFSTAPETFTFNNGSKINSTAIPFTLTGGSNKFTNIVSGLHFDPEPVYRAHIEDPNENVAARQGLGNASIRDLDGSLSGTGENSVLVATRSLGATNLSRCQDGGETFYNFKICPSDYSEGSLTFMSWDSPYLSPWATPFIVRRSDGALNYPMNEWNQIGSIANNLFATVNNLKFSYQLLPMYQYEKARSLGAHAAMDANAEILSPLSPIVKIVAYGNNCRLEDGAIKVNSLAELKQQTSTSYYTQGKDFYVRVIPKTKWDVITNGSVPQATAYTTIPTRHAIKCDEAYLPHEVIGQIGSVIRGSTTTTISGWACNFTHSSPIKVKLYAFGPALQFAASNKVSRNPNTLSFNSYSYLTEMTSNQASDPKVAFNCGKLSSAGRNFSFTIANSELMKFANHRIYIKGISNSGGTDSFISGSGNYFMIPKVVNPAFPNKSK